MSASEEMIAAEAARLSLDEKKPSIAKSHSSATSSSSSSSSSSSDEEECRYFKGHPCGHQQFPGNYFAPQPYLMPFMGGFLMTPLCPCLMEKLSVPHRSCHRRCKSRRKSSSKCRKASKSVDDSAKAEEKSCDCCAAGKCECCKTGKECTEKEDKTDEKSDKSGDESGEDDGKEGNEDGEEDE